MSQTTWHLGMIVVLGGLLAGGCNDAAPRLPPATSGRQVFDRMVDAYRGAQSYADSGEVLFSYEGAQKASERYPFSTTLVRPNKLRLHCYSASIVCDGKLLQAAIDELPNQVLSLSAPATLTTSEIYANDMLANALAYGPASGPIQLALLFDPKPLDPILNNGEEPKLLEAKPIDGDRCYRVEVKRPDGTFTFWVDDESYVLRRIEFPTDAFEKELSKQGPISNLSLVVELKGARINQPVDDVAFRFEPPAGAVLVKNFSTAPRPEPPSDLLGKPVPEFEFTVDGKPFSRDSAKGKILVLDFWASWCQPCLTGLPNLQQVYDKYKDNPKVMFLAVSVDTTSEPPAKGETAKADNSGVSDQELRKIFEELKLAVPIARDPRQSARVSFGVQSIPNTFIVGPDSRVEFNELGVNPDTPAELPKRLEKLLAGGSTAEDCRQEYAQHVREYEDQLRAEPSTQELPKGVIAPPSEPVTLKRTKLWSCDKLKQPGNLIVVEGKAGAPEILVCDGWGSVARLDAKGQVIATHTLKLPKEPEEGIVSFLRPATDSDGRKLFIGGASSRQQIHVFDEQFERLYSYPEQTSAGGIADAEVGDLNGDGHPEIIVSYFDVVGVHCLSLKGERLWANRAAANVYRTALTSPDKQGQRVVLCANERGFFLPIDATGKEGDPIIVDGRGMRAVFSAELGTDGARSYCGLAINKPGQESLVGFDLSGKQLWDFTLPPGLQNYAPLEMVTSGQVVPGAQKQWVCAGADGSVHILAADGTEIDRFHCGAAITGLSASQLDGPTLVIASGSTIEAWKISSR